MSAQSQPAPGKPLSAYDIYIQENIARREALRVKPHPYTPKNEPIRTEVKEAHEPVKDSDVAEIPVQPKAKKKSVRKKPVTESDTKAENRTKAVKPRPGRTKNKTATPANKTLQNQPRAGPV